MKSTEQQIKEAITQRKRGDLWVPDDFRKSGSSEAVRLGLHRLEKEGFIRRISQGIYVRPKKISL